jgi:hypothetical protein
MEKKGNRDTVRAAKIKLTSEIVRVSDRQVQRVLNAERVNEKVVSVYMYLDEGMDKLVKEAQRICPF